MYSKITPQQLISNYDSVEAVKYLIDHPINIILFVVEDLIEIGELECRHYSPQQIVDLGYIIISKHQIFRSDIRKWMRRPLLQQTWPNFKSYFTVAHQELRNTDVTVDELGFSGANAIASQIVYHLRPEVPTETEQIVTTTPPLLSDNIPTANTVQATLNPDIASLMASMLANIEAMRVRLK